MSQQPVGAAYDTDDRSDEQIARGVTAKPTLGELVVGVRVDTLPQSEAERLAGEGKFYPLTMDANGSLRVTVPDGVKVKSNELAMLQEIRNAVEKCLQQLMKIA